METRQGPLPNSRLKPEACRLSDALTHPLLTLVEISGGLRGRRQLGMQADHLPKSRTVMICLVDLTHTRAPKKRKNEVKLCHQDHQGASSKASTIHCHHSLTRFGLYSLHQVGKTEPLPLRCWIPSTVL